MGRESSITYVQVAAIADAMKAAGANPTSRAVRERLGNIGSMGTINKLLQTWKTGEEHAVNASLTLPAPLQRAILEFLAQELAASTATIEAELVDQLQEAADLATENEAQAKELDANAEALHAARNELAILQGRILQVEAESLTTQTQLDNERRAAEAVRAELTKARHQLEVVPRIEAELVALRNEAASEHAGRVAAEQQAAVLTARLDAADTRAGDIEAREKTALARIVELERQLSGATRELANANLSVQGCQARLESASRELESSRKLSADARANERKATEEAAELRGMLLSDRTALADVRAQLAKVLAQGDAKT
ncbi:MULTISPECIES: DNA-binding protein [unclassified Janthinobacterium]|uniref:DNA-binding protein n=1 Tax=unclassified Janthinobacterium TaxID=2610881 RepID=UPI001613100B|nr:MULTISPECIES: DNA-binding protein [unclassified Janthinobacterium]MBB5610580.1 chromosome segregation ATPase [Janthinobacterium sp. S3T4]MBB5615966.1 chromosome segregation ATPase [Janthinobacterium sp. S3M3]